MTKSIQQTLYKDENEGLGLVDNRIIKNNSISSNPKKIRFPNKKTSRERKIMAEEYDTSPKKIVEVDAWMNIGGKGVFVKIEGKEYITSIESVKALLSGEKQGVKLGLLKKE